MMLPPPECSSISGTAAAVSAWAVDTLNVNASRRSFVEVFSSALGMVPPTLLTTMSSLPNASTAAPASLAVSSGWARSATTMCARRPAARICSATSSSCGLRAGRDHHVRTGFRECERHRRAEPAARAGDYGDLIVEPESVENHVCLSSVAGRHGSKARPRSRGRFLKHVLVWLRFTHRDA